MWAVGWVGGLELDAGAQDGGRVLVGCVRKQDETYASGAGGVRERRKVCVSGAWGVRERRRVCVRGANCARAERRGGVPVGCGGVGGGRDWA